ncbi:MAG: hypothetical protein OSJ62_11965 [Lachnospiraceae bacterium]|nr:hypothetical protein [Lachnospiraceae bacterium]
MPETGKGFVGYEYRDILCKKSIRTLYEDCIISFGWQQTGEESVVGKPDSVNLKYKRNRKIGNKAELARLQKQFEACIRDILSLEHNKIILAAVVAYLTGVAGIVFMLGSVFFMISDNIAIGIVLIVPGIVGLILPYPVYAKIRLKKAEQMESLIRQKYDEVYSVCEKASGLIG